MNIRMQFTPPYLVAHYYWLDLIRFLAAFLVLLCHCRGAFLPEYANLPASQHTPLVFLFYSMSRLGDEAVMIFFVLSGFLVGGKVIERSKNGSFRIRNYVIDRAVRIMLPLISALLLTIMIRAIYNEPLHLSRIIGNLLSLQGIVCDPEIMVLWSLSYEVWFYVLAGAIAVFLSGHSRRSYLVFCVIVMCFIVFSRLSAHYLFIWITGAFAFCCRPQTFSRLKCWGWLLIAISMIPLLQLTIDSNMNFPVFDFINSWDHKILQILFGMFIGLFIQQVILSVPKFKLTASIDKAGTWLASFSYTLYLVHVPLMYLFQKLGAQRAEMLDAKSLGWFILYLAGGLLGSYIIYLGFERNTSKAKRFLYNLIDKKTIAV